MTKLLAELNSKTVYSQDFVKVAGQQIFTFELLLQDCWAFEAF
ncbi:MAG: hypothetical protein FD169_2303 [Bacillota bacterium]|nr:MAG: hypothetical protein FD169_2303 [Bacillota bacterium]